MNLKVITQTMNLYFDEIVNKNPVPNGLSIDDDLKNLYLKNYEEYKLYTFLEVPRLFFLDQKHTVNYLKLEVTTIGYYALCFDLLDNNLINPINLKYTFNLGISKLARTKTLNNELKILLFINNCNKNINQDISTINNTLQQFTSNFIIVTEDKHIKINTFRGDDYK